jgi:hypothetical protein
MPTALKYMNGNQVNYKLIAGSDVLASILPEDPDPDMWVVDITGEAQETPLQEILTMIDEAGLKDFEKQALIMKIKKAAQGAGSTKHLERIVDDLIKRLEQPKATGVKYAYGKRVDEAKYQGKEVALNKPKRGGSKKFFVYTKNPKTGKVVKVSFGGTTGLKAKINNAEARKSFAARHNCATKKDKTKSGYWSCRLPRYAKLLGLKSSFGGYW